MKRRKTPPAIHVYMPVEMQKQLATVAKKHGVQSRALLVRMVLAHYLGSADATAAAVKGGLFE